MCNVDTFWEKMCHPAFFRLSLNTGIIGNETFFTETPPEMIPGFIENILDSIVSSLRLKMPKKHWYSLGRPEWPWRIST